MSYLLKTSTLIVALLIALLWGCTDPLTVDVPRKETPLTPAPKVIPTSVIPDFSTQKGDYIFAGMPTFQVDTTVSPMRIWMDFTLGVVPDTVSPLIQAFRIKLDSVGSDGLIYNLVGDTAQMQYDNGTGIGLFWWYCDLTVNTVSIVIAEKDRAPGKPREVDITIYLIANKDGSFPVEQEQLLGVIHLVI